MTRFILKTYHFFSKHIILFIFILLGIVAGGFFSLFNLKLENNISNVLPKDGDLAKFEHILEKTSTGNKLIFILKSDEKDIDSLLQNGKDLQFALEEMNTDSLFESVSIENKDQDFIGLLNGIYNQLPIYVTKNDLASLSLNEDSLRKKIQNKFRVLFTPAGSMMKSSIVNDPLDLSLPALKRLKSLQIDNNFSLINSYLISNDSTYLLGFVNVSERINEDNNKKIIQQAVGNYLAKVNENSTTKHYVFGAAIIAEENAQRIKKDIMLTVNIALTLLLLALALYYKSIKVLPGFIIPIILGSSVALIFLFVKQSLVSAISLGMGSVLLGTIIDYTLHTLTHLRKTGSSEDTIKHTAAPILAGSITTSTAFLALILIGSKALTDLAIFAAASMIFGALFSILVLPILYKNTFKEGNIKKNKLDKFVSYNFHKNKYIIGFCLLIVFLSFIFIKNIGFVKDLNQLNYMPHYIAEAELELHKASNALQSNLVLVVEKENINEAVFQTEKLEEFLKQSPIAIDEIKSATSLVSSLNKKEVRVKEWQNFWTDERINLVKKIIQEEADKLGIQRTAFADFFQQLSTPTYYSDPALNKLTANYISLDKEDNKVYSTIVVKLPPENKEALTAQIKNFDKDIYILDRSSAVKSLVGQVKESLKTISWILLGLILLILSVYFKNIELVSLAFIPVALSWLTTLGIMGLLHIDFNMLNIIIVIFIFGLGIDYSIFILNALVNDYRTGETHFNTVKSSVLLSAFTTFTGIGVLIFAKHPALYSIATAGMIAILSVFTYAIVLLPFFFYLLVNNRIKHQFEPITYGTIYHTFLSYSSLVFGVIFITTSGFILKLLFFIPLAKRKLFFHKLFNFWASFYIKIIFPGKRFTFENPKQEDFERPAVIIANHQSLLDTPLMVSLHPKIILLTKDWVRNNILFGLGARLADFYSVDSNKEELLNNLKQKVQEGFSIAVFPEGTRSKNKNLLRFYRGAFQLAYDLKLDIVPVVINGTIDTVHKNQFWGQRRNLHVLIGNRILKNDTTFGETKMERYKLIRNHYKELYYNALSSHNSVKLLEKQVLSNYLYKGNGLFKKAKNELKAFSYFDKLLPFLKNNKSTLIYGDDLGLLSIAQTLLSKDKVLTLQTDNTDFVSNLYHLHNTTVVSKNAILEANYEQVLYVTKVDNTIPETLKNMKQIIIINTSNHSISIS